MSWNTRELLLECLDALERWRPRRLREIWVVDNASTDGSPEAVRRRHPGVRLIRNDANVGFAKANNQALAELGGADVLLLNSDARVLPGAVDRMIAALDREPTVGIVGAHLLNPDGSLQRSCWRAPTPRRELAHLLGLESLGWGLTYPMARWTDGRARDVEVAQGAALLARAEVVARIGPLDEGYFMFSEETEWCERARRAGWRVVWQPGAFVLHHGGASTEQVPDEMFLELYRSKLRFLRRNRGAASARAFKALLGVASLGKVLVSTGARDERHVSARRYGSLLRQLPSM